MRQQSEASRHRAAQLHNYHGVNERFPIGVYRVRATGLNVPNGYKAPFVVGILSYIEQTSLFNSDNMNLLFNVADNATTRLAVIQVYQCPSDVSQIFNELVAGAFVPMVSKGSYGLNWGINDYWDHGMRNGVTAAPFYKGYGTRAGAH